MLAKLFKYEIKATARFFLPLYAALWVFALFNRIINPLKVLETAADVNFAIIASFLSMIAYYALIVGIIVMTIILMIQRFYKNLLGDEGYLMFTLPVKTWQHVVNKLGGAVIWTILSFLVTVGSILFVVSSAVDISEPFIQMKVFIQNQFGWFGYLLVPIYAVLIVSSNYMMVYTAIALGHQFAKHKLIASIGMYCGLYMFWQMVLAGIMLVLFGLVSQLRTDMIFTSQHLNMFVAGIGLMQLIMTGIHFTMTHLILKKRLNLE